MAQAEKTPLRLLSPANFNAPPGPPLALGAALAIWLFANAELNTTLMALLVAALVGIGYVRARREASAAQAALADAEARLAEIKRLLSPAGAPNPGMDVEQLQAAALKCAQAIGAPAPRENRQAS